MSRDGLVESACDSGAHIWCISSSFFLSLFLFFPMFRILVEGTLFIKELARNKTEMLAVQNSSRCTRLTGLLAMEKQVHKEACPKLCFGPGKAMRKHNRKTRERAVIPNRFHNYRALADLDLKLAMLPGSAGPSMKLADHRVIRLFYLRKIDGTKP